MIFQGNPDLHRNNQNIDGDFWNFQEFCGFLLSEGNNLMVRILKNEDTAYVAIFSLFSGTSSILRTFWAGPVEKIYNEGCSERGQESVRLA